MESHRRAAEAFPPKTTPKALASGDGMGFFDVPPGSNDSSRSALSQCLLEQLHRHFDLDLASRSARSSTRSHSFSGKLSDRTATAITEGCQQARLVSLHRACAQPSLAAGRPGYVGSALCVRVVPLCAPDLKTSSLRSRSRPAAPRCSDRTSTCPTQNPCKWHLRSRLRS